MKIPVLSTGLRVVASFAVVLLFMAGMTAVSLWRLQAGADTASDLVNDKLAKQQLTSELLGEIRLGGLRAMFVARADSLEVGELIQAQLAAGEKTLDTLEGKLAALPHSAGEQALLDAAAQRKAAYLALRTQVFKLKDLGKVQEVGELVDGKMDAAFEAWLAAQEDLLDYQTRLARAQAAASASQFGNSRAVLLGLGVAALLVGVALAWLLIRSVLVPLKRAVALAGQVAEGNLGIAIEHGRGDEIGQLFDALSEMTSRLAATVGQVRDGAEAIDTASREIASGNLDLSRRTEHHAGALEETASSMEQLTVAVRRNSSHAREANQLALSASNVAGKGGQVVAEVVDTMDAINEFAKKIVDITGVIDGIAFQTNILALNAAVEAARAGEQGRGFAVVASEVRNLAQRSAHAAREIKKLISDSADKIASGSALAHTAGTTMDDIVASVQRVTTIMAAISSASSEQELGIRQVNSAITEMDSVTQQNAALVEEAAAAADAMQAQARELARNVGYFTLGAPAARRLAPAASPPAAALPAPQWREAA